MKPLFIIGSKVNDISLSDTIKKIDNHLQSNNKGYIVTPNPEICLKAYQDKRLRRIIRGALIAIPDGFGLKIGGLFWGRYLKNITTGSDLTLEILKLAEQKNYSVLFFEGIPKIAEKALSNIKNKYPKININYIDPGKVTAEGNIENKNIISKINDLNPNIILVNFGAPKQEYFINKNIDLLNTKLMMGVGGSIDFIAGIIKRAPKIFRNIGLEWLWRLFQEPKRLPRIIKATIIFPIACIRFRLGELFIYRNNVAGFIINRDKKIFIAKHAHVNDWKLPQGGAKKAKTIKELSKEVLKEMKQEVGTDKFKILDVVKNCHKYKWPKENNYNWDHFKGQKQSLFLLEFTGTDDDINIDLHEHSDWQWVSQNDILNIVGKSRKKIITIGLTKFKKYL